MYGYVIPLPLIDSGVVFCRRAVQIGDMTQTNLQIEEKNLTINCLICVCKLIEIATMYMG